MTKNEYYLGFDLSTQQLKCLVIDGNLQLCTSVAVDFASELDHYETNKGVYIKGNVVESPVNMWLEAIDLVLQKLVAAGLDLSLVVAISGSCQQHGAVFWSAEAGALLANLSCDGNLVDQLGERAFSRSTAPNWQDHSTGEQCREFTDAMGGQDKLAEVTGSRAHLRFTGPQILKIAESEPSVYANTETISLVSSFLQSILCGNLTPLEEADACGMNLYNIQEHKFDAELLNLIDSKTSRIVVLKNLLGQPVTGYQNPVWSKTISEYFVGKYKFNPKTEIYPITGDNLATICSLPLQKNDVLVSMGTSTTVMLVTDKYVSSPNYHVFNHPTIPDHYMYMICYSNGSLAREMVRDEINDDLSRSWDLFNECVSSEKTDTADELGLYLPIAEIVPQVESGFHRVKFDTATGEIVSKVDKFVNEPKNIVEQQALSCRVRLTPLLNGNKNNIGEMVTFDNNEIPLSSFSHGRPNKVFFVGGASQNDAIIKKFAKILGAKNGNYRFSNTSNSCALGGCYKALWSQQLNSSTTDLSFDQYLSSKFDWDTLEYVCDSNQKDWESYLYKIKPLSKLESLCQRQ